MWSTPWSTSPVPWPASPAASGSGGASGAAVTRPASAHAASIRATSPRRAERGRGGRGPPGAAAPRLSVALRPVDAVEVQGQMLAEVVLDDDAVARAVMGDHHVVARVGEVQVLPAGVG